MVWRHGGCTYLADNIKSEFYWEPQSGGLCRMHSINAYFGRPIYNSATFEAEIEEFNSRRKILYKDLPGAELFDITTGDQKNIITHILAKHGIFARIYSFAQRNRAIEKSEEYKAAFICSPEHIWIIRKSAPETPENENKWFKIDSIGGVTSFNIADLVADSRLSIIVPTTNLVNEFTLIGQELETLVMPDIVNYLIDTFRNKKVIGDAEILMGSAISLLEIQNNNRTPPKPIAELFAWYNNFVNNFFGKNCASMHFILSSVPQILARIIAIWRGLRKCRSDQP